MPIADGFYYPGQWLRTASSGTGSGNTPAAGSQQCLTGAGGLGRHHIPGSVLKLTGLTWSRGVRETANQGDERRRAGREQRVETSCWAASQSTRHFSRHDQSSEVKNPAIPTLAV